jgi:phosphoadenosine phosphosulfate reductase
MITIDGATESERLENLSFPDEIARAQAIAEWAVETFADDLVLTASFQDAVMINLLRSVKPDIEVVYLDTQYSFPETITYRDELTNKLHLNLRVVEPQVSKGEQFLLDVGTDACCNARKVQPLQGVLDGKAAWLSGIRRVETPERADTPIVAWNNKWNLFKVSPIATWSDEDVERYQRDNDLPVHPLTIPNPESGLVYSSIGCEPCTLPFRQGEDARASRWNGEKTECGLHV